MGIQAQYLYEDVKADIQEKINTLDVKKDIPCKFSAVNKK